METKQETIEVEKVEKNKNVEVFPASDKTNKQLQNGFNAMVNSKCNFTNFAIKRDELMKSLKEQEDSIMADVVKKEKDFVLVVSSAKDYTLPENCKKNNFDYDFKSKSFVLKNNIVLETKGV